MLERVNPEPGAAFFVVRWKVEARRARPEDREQPRGHYCGVMMPPRAWRRGRTMPRWSTSAGDWLEAGREGRSINAPPQAGHQSAWVSGPSTARQWVQIRSMLQRYSIFEGNEGAGQLSGSGWLGDGG